MSEVAPATGLTGWSGVFGTLLTGAADFHFSKELEKQKQESSPATVGTQTQQVTGYEPGRVQNVNATPMTGNDLGKYLLEPNKYLGLNNGLLLLIAFALMLYLARK